LLISCLLKFKTLPEKYKHLNLSACWNVRGVKPRLGIKGQSLLIHFSDRTGDDNSIVDIVHTLKIAEDFLDQLL
jgi:hypothetical protein